MMGERKMTSNMLDILNDRIKTLSEQVEAGNYCYAHSIGMSVQQQLEFLVYLLGRQGVKYEELVD